MFKSPTIILGLALAFPLVASAEQANRLDLHNGYWVTKANPPGFGPRIAVVNDMHVDPDTMRVTVYAQSRVFGRVVSPPQVNPGECTDVRGGEKLCFHPNAVYLNGTGQEFDYDAGDGAWWVKHSWVLGGEGYCNTELMPPKEVYDPCLPVKGTLLEDGLTVKVGSDAPITDANAKVFYNLRSPVIEDEKVRYKVARFEWDESTPESDPVAGFALLWDCKTEESAFNGIARACPKVN